MSHEGIRFISEEESQKLAQEAEHRVLAEPAHVRVQKTAGTGMEIDWKDGHQSSWTFTWLREACPCATCHEERGATGRKPGEAKPQPPALLQMYKAPPGRSPFPPWAATRSVFAGTTATRVGSTPGTTFGAIANASPAAPLQLVSRHGAGSPGATWQTGRLSQSFCTRCSASAAFPTT